LVVEGAKLGGFVVVIVVVAGIVLEDRVVAITVNFVVGITLDDWFVVFVVVGAVEIL